jgi:hypothetical protein
MKRCILVCFGLILAISFCEKDPCVDRLIH